MEWKIGEIKQVNGEWYQCIEGTGCYQCAFNNEDNACQADNPHCLCRSDKKKVVFKKLEKVGEPFSCNYYGDARLIMMQEYQLFGANVIYSYSMPPMYITDYKHNRIAIEITEKKEGMEVCKMQDAREDIPEFDKVVDECLFGEDKLKPFDIQKAKDGKPVCTRDGRKARIICFDMNSFNNHIIVALITEENGTESISSYTIEGKWKETETENDLMMLPEKKEGWAVIKKSDIYETEEQAVDAMLNCRVGVMIRKITWEE